MKAAVYTGTRNLYEHMAVAMKSLLAHSTVEKVYLLIEDDVFPYTLPPEAEAINVSGMCRALFPAGGPNSDTPFRPICMMRAACARVLPEELETVLQLDVDTVVAGDADGIWETDLTGKYFAAVPEYRGSYKPYGPKYYNAGVMLLNLKKIREDGMDGTLIDFLNRERVPYIDQDAWNRFGAEAAADLPVRYNECFVTGETNRPVIVHYAGVRDWTTSETMPRREYLLRARAAVRGAIPAGVRLMIAVPTIDYIHFAFAERLTALVMRLKDMGVEFSVRFQGNTMVYLARDALAARAMEEGFSHVLWLDADMLFPETLAEDLWESGKSFVSGVYHARRPPHRSCVFTNLNPVERPDWEYPAEPFRIAGCGFGCVMVETAVLKAVELGTGVLFLPDGAFGEDLSFCRRATALGHEIWCQPRAVCGHIGQMAVYPEAQREWQAGREGYRGVYG